MLTTITVTSKRQVTLPKGLLETLGIEQGDQLIARNVGKKITLEPKGRGILDLAGKFGDLEIPKGKTVDDLIEEATLEAVKDVLPRH